MTVGYALADERPERVRLCVVVPLTGGRVVAAEVEDRLAGSCSSPARCTPRPPGSAAWWAATATARPQDVLARDGWHNVFVAPEVAEGPGGRAR